MIKSGARTCRITDHRLDCSRAVLHSRQCAQMFAGIWHGARPEQRLEAHEGGARANEAELRALFWPSRITERGQAAVGCPETWAMFGSAGWWLALPPKSAFFEQ